MTSEIKAPYNFVPLSNWIFSPSWAEQVSHDVPFEDGLSGTIRLRLETMQPLLVGGAQKNEYGDIEFLKDPVTSRPVIPGSSLKGMLRSVLEVASFSKLNYLNDDRYAVRDLSSKENGKSVNNFYMRRMKGSKAGFLRYENNRWVVRACRYYPILQEDYVTAFGVDVNHWFDEKKISSIQRYEIVDSAISDQKGEYPKRINFVVKDVDKDMGGKSVPVSHAFVSNSGDDGYLVITGQPNISGCKNFKDLNGKKSYKKVDFVFYDISGKDFYVDDDVIGNFIELSMEDNGGIGSSPWGFWKENAFKTVGIPVFWHEKDGGVGSLGLSSMYRLPYEYSTHDVVRNTSTAHLDDKVIDLCELLFGRLGDEVSIRGRVNITSARSSQENYVNPIRTILSSPKASYFPNYLVQNEPNKYVTMFDRSIVRGRKRYPVRSRLQYPDMSDIDNDAVKTTIKPVSSGSLFDFKIHFHNLKVCELGALLWAIDFGGRPECYHSLGMGKSIGLGGCRLSVTDLDAANGCQYDLYAGCVSIFEDTMLKAFNLANKNTSQSFDALPQIQSLLRMAKPDSVETGWMKLGEFADRKKDGKILQESCVYENPTGLISDASVTNEVGEKVNIAASLKDGSTIEMVRKMEEKMVQEKEFEEMPESIRFMQEKVSWVLGQKANSAQPGDAYFSEILGYLTEPPEVLNNPQDMKYLAHVCYLLCKEKAGGKWSSKKYEKTHGRSRKQKANELMAGDMISEEDIRGYYKL